MKQKMNIAFATLVGLTALSSLAANANPLESSDIGQPVEGAFDQARPLPPTLLESTHFGVRPCCEGVKIAGGGYATYSSNVNSAGQITQNLDMMFAMRSYAGIDALSDAKTLSTAKLVVSFQRGERTYAECGLAFDPFSRAARFDLTIEAVDQAVKAESGWCDTDMQQRGVQSGVPRVHDQDRLKLFVVDGPSGLIEIARGGVVNIAAD